MASTRKHVAAVVRHATAQLPYLARAVRLVWTAAGGWSRAWVLLLIAQGLLPVALVYLTRAVVNALVDLAPPSPSTALGPALGLVAAMAGVVVLMEVLRGVAAWVRTAQAELVRDHISGLIHAQAARIDLGFYETPEYHDRMFRARADAAQRPVALLENLGSLAQNGLTLIAMAGVLLPFGAWLPLVLVVSTIPALRVVLRFTLRQHQWRVANTAAERRAQYFDWLQTFQGAAAELRVFGLGEQFREAYQRVRGGLRRERVALAREQARAEIAAGGVALVVTGGTVAWMIWQTTHGRASLGDVALLYQAFNQGQRLLRTLLEHTGQLYGNSLFLENLFEFLALEPRIVDPPQPVAMPRTLARGVTFEDVSFHYPGSDRPALDRCALTVGAGQVVAIVGANGAGKTTILKLLCRVYDPDGGRILLDGTDLRAFRLDDVRRRITVLFQQPVQYQDTVAHNIGFGDPARAADREAIESAAIAAGADVTIARLPQAYDTLLGKWFGGTDLSVGEWQRIALARAFLRQAAVVLLDEPTSAMDSWAEASWLERFRSLVEGRVAIVITHRFTTAMRADVIHVMEAGRIVESGTHAELVGGGGRYGTSWGAQMATERPDASPGGRVERLVRGR